jgi:hypothetical protein
VPLPGRHETPAKPRSVVSSAITVALKLANVARFGPTPAGDVTRSAQRVGPNRSAKALMFACGLLVQHSAAPGVGTRGRLDRRRPPTRGRRASRLLAASRFDRNATAGSRSSSETRGEQVGGGGRVPGRGGIEEPRYLGHPAECDGYRLQLNGKTHRGAVR